MFPPGIPGGVGDIVMGTYMGYYSICEPLYSDSKHGGGPVVKFRCDTYLSRIMAVLLQLVVVEFCKLEEEMALERRIRARNGKYEALALK